ncbi:MAG: ABC transporter permease [Cyclobacteriaceae bacterium]|nr:ABC transporter permease [Cyclobacteriaceae bacterium]
MYIILAWRNIWRNKRRSIITIASITFAVFLASFMRSMQLGSYERMIENAAGFYTGYIQVHQNGYWNEKTIDNSMVQDQVLIEKIESIKGVNVAVPRVESFVLASFGIKTKGSLVMGIDPNKENALTRLKNKLVDGEFLKTNDKSVLVAEGLAEYLKVGVGDSLVMIGQGYHGSNAAGIYPIKGIVKFPVPDQNNQTVYMPLKEAQWLFDVDGRLTSIALVVDKVQMVDRIVTEISSEVDTEKLEIMGWRDLMPDLVQGIEIDNVSGRIMLWILYSVIGFGMFGTFMMMTAERMYEFGVMMSVGMKRIIMQWIIVLEMAMMATIGVLAGIGISLPFLIYYHNNPIMLTGEAAAAIENFGIEAGYFFSLQASLFYNQAWAIFFMAIVLGFYPIYVIQRLKPVEAMREA